MEYCSVFMFRTGNSRWDSATDIYDWMEVHESFAAGCRSSLVGEIWVGDTEQYCIIPRYPWMMMMMIL